MSLTDFKDFNDFTFDEMNIRKIKSKIMNATDTESSETTFILNDLSELSEYFEKMIKIIRDILSRPAKEVITFDILDTKKQIQHKLLILKVKQYQMKVGEIWQEAIGNYIGFINLKIGHETGLDILSHTRKLAIELKNRTNTDNASSKKSNFDKLAKFKKEHPDYICIYANINDDTEDKTLRGFNKKLIHNDAEIEHYVGYEFLKFIFGENTQQIIEFIKITIDKYT